MKIVFDFGGVLFHWHPASFLARVWPHRAATVEEGASVAKAFFQNYGGDWGLFDQGLIGADEVIGRIVARTGWPIEDVEAVLRAVPGELALIPGTAALITDLRAAGHTLHYLSNMPEPFADHLASAHPAARVVRVGPVLGPGQAHQARCGNLPAGRAAVRRQARGTAVPGRSPGQRGCGAEPRLAGHPVHGCRGGAAPAGRAGLAGGLVQRLAVGSEFVRVLRRRGRHAKALAGPGAQVDLPAALAAEGPPFVAGREDAVAAALRAAHDARLGLGAHRHRASSKLVSCAASFRRPSSSWRIRRMEIISRWPEISGMRPRLGSMRMRSR